MTANDAAAGPAVAPPEASAASQPTQPLRDIAKAFKRLHESILSQESSGSAVRMDLKLLVAACETINVLFGLLGVAFAFAGRDYVDKVKDIKGACAEFQTVEEMLQKDISAKTVKNKGSHSRNLLRVCRGLDLNKRLFEYLLQDSTQTLRAVAGRAYEEVFSKHHSWAIRSLVSAGLLALPSAEVFLGHLHEDVDSCKEPAGEFVSDVGPVIKYLESMFVAEGLGIDW